VLWFGPESQAVLREFMARRPVTDALFCPRDEIAQRSEEAECHRRADQKPNPKKTGRVVGEWYAAKGITQSIRRAVQTRNQMLAEKLERPLKPKEMLEMWHAYRLRHSFATRARAQFGLEAASASLGHASVKITELYALADEQAAREVARRLG
jgi:hypothetical protein